MKRLCIYHGNCADGFGAAWVVRKYFGEDNVEFFPATHGNPPPDVTGRDVIIVDFSYKRAVLLEMLKTAQNILIIDHHKTAIDDIGDLDEDGLQMFLMLEHSGAMLAWMYYFPDTPTPKLIDYVQDRDLWQWKLECSREVSAAVFSYPYDFKVWDDIIANNFAQLVVDGVAIERAHFKNIKELLTVCQRKLKIGGFVVPAASLPYTMSSDAGHFMAQGEPFAVCYYDTPNGRTFSLRSAEDGEDVSLIAKQYGGGGHKHAAGFSVPLSRINEFEL